MICPFETYAYYCPFYSFRSQKTPQLKNKFRVPLITSHTEEVINKNDKITEYLRVPILEGNINPQILNNMNKNIRSDILEFKNEMENAAEDNWDYNIKQGKKVVPIEISNIYTITYDKNNILSLSILYQENINNRNSFIRSSYNYDLKNGKALSLNDLFKPGVDYVKILNNAIRNEIETNQNVYFPNTLKNFKGINQYQPFYLDDASLNIYFGFNEIAPLASEIPIIKIPLSDLKEALNPAFS